MVPNLFVNYTSGTAWIFAQNNHHHSAAACRLSHRFVKSMGGNIQCACLPDYSQKRLLVILCWNLLHCLVVVLTFILSSSSSVLAGAYGWSNNNNNKREKTRRQIVHVSQRGPLGVSALDCTYLTNRNNSVTSL